MTKTKCATQNDKCHVNLTDVHVTGS